MKYRRIFIAIEGGDGAGKTTQTQLLAAHLERLNISRLVLHEPGGTAIGENLRNLLKSSAPMVPRTELLLFEAARAQLVEEQIIPALQEGTVVITDRFAASSIAYQGYGRGLEREVVAHLNTFASQGLEPDLTILLDIDPLEGLKRKETQDNTEGRRFEDLDLEFHRRARQGFLDQAAYEPVPWLVIDATGSVAAIESEIWNNVVQLID